MKKITILLVMFALLTPFLFAQELGLSVGAELGLFNATEANDEDRVFGITPFIEYNNSIDVLDLYARAKWWLLFDDPMAQNPEIELEAAYNIDMGPGVLAIVLWNESYMYISDGDSSYDGYVEPSVRYTISGDFGDLSFQPGFGLWYEKDEDAQFDISFGIGYYNPIGFGINAKIFYNISKGPEEFREYRVLPYYETGPFYFEIDFRAYGQKFDSISMWPYIEYAVTDRISVWAWLEIENLAKDGSDVSLTPVIGAAWKF